MSIKRFNLTSLLTAAMFAVAFFAVASARTAQAQNNGQVAAYVWANDKASASYTPNASYSFNSKKGANSIKREGAGVYLVTFGGLKTTGGHAQVTSYGAGNDHCKISNWNPAGADMTIKVLCFNGAGAPADAQFALVMFN